VRLNRIKIENFRSIKNVEVELKDTTVFIGPNNSGKTAILDAIRIALTRKWGRKGTGFTEYDVHLASDDADPKTAPSILIEAIAEETSAGEWPQPLHDDLDEIIQSDPHTGRASIILRATCQWNPAEACFDPSWAFLNVNRAPLAGISARRMNLERFWQYLPVFYLGALRDANDEFSARSQFWGRLLEAIDIPSKLESRVQGILEKVNKRLLEADPRLGQIVKVLMESTEVAARDRDGSASVRLLPLKTWDLLSKAEIILRNEPDWPWLPLQRHGQGLQSLSVIFLFKAFVQHLLHEQYEKESSPILALEEPETHLHPQAARTLWRHVSSLPGQKLVTTHSPYFVQHVPFRDLRLVRLTSDGTKVFSLPEVFTVSLPYVPSIDAVIGKSAGALSYDEVVGTLSVRGKLEEKQYHDLLACFSNPANVRTLATKQLTDLRERSILFISDEDLESLETFARRIRGEIFFARRWLLIEGQAEYLLVHALAVALQYGLDEHGVSVIDAVNNGNPQIFASLARALGIPWIAVLDGDQQGESYRKSIVSRDFDQRFVESRCKLLPGGDLEAQLLADGFETELRDILQSIGHKDALKIDLTGLKQRLAKYKTAYAAELANRILKDNNLAAKMPKDFREAISNLSSIS
jgi:putative ATP-dependent endonuclease of OLD family